MRQSCSTRRDEVLGPSRGARPFHVRPARLLLDSRRSLSAQREWTAGSASFVPVDEKVDEQIAVIAAVSIGWQGVY